LLGAQPVLSVTNGRTGAENRTVQFSMRQLLAFEQHEVLTANDFVEGKKLFSGPLARDIVKRADMGPATMVLMTAANDYTVQVPLTEFYDYDVILALSMEGRKFTLRDKGPIWLIYPMSDFAELRDPFYNHHLIWQLVKMELK
jgi:hypothetical protein